MDGSLTALAEIVAHRLGGRRVAAAESFTAGLLSQALASAERSAEWFAGGLVVHRTDSAPRALGLMADGIRDEGATLEMARGVARLFDVPAAVAVTGVAGPEPEEGHRAGTVFVACRVDGREQVRTLVVPDRHDREAVKVSGARAALSQLTLALAVMPFDDDLHAGREI